MTSVCQYFIFVVAFLFVVVVFFNLFFLRLTFHKMCVILLYNRCFLSKGSLIVSFFAIMQHVFVANVFLKVKKNLVFGEFSEIFSIFFYMKRPGSSPHSGPRPDNHGAGTIWGAARWQHQSRAAISCGER